MKQAIHRTNNFNDDYEIVEILKNPIDPNNGFAEIRHKDGSITWTGGILCEVTDPTLYVLNNMSPEEQYEWLKSIKVPDVYEMDHYNKKSYYYTIPTGKPHWDEEKQDLWIGDSWEDFVNFCKELSKNNNNVTIRGCETPGYNNQGHYFNA